MRWNILQSDRQKLKFILFFLFFYLGCQDSQTPTIDFSTALNKSALIQEKFAQGLWNERKFELADTLFTLDFYTEAMANPPGNWIEMHGKGPKSMVHHIQWWLKILPDAKLTIIDIVENDQTVIETWELRGTMQDSLLGRAPTNKPLKVLGCTVSYFEGEKIKLHKTLLDKFSLLQQLGVSR